MLLVECLTKTNNEVFLRVSLNNRTKLFQTYPVSKLKQLVNNTQTVSNDDECHFRGLKVQLEIENSHLGSVHLGPDATIQFDLSPQVPFQDFKIVSHGRVYIKNIRGQNIMIKSRSVRFYGRNIARESIEYQYYQSYEGVDIRDSGTFQISNKGALEVKTMKVTSGADILIKKGSQLKFTSSRACLKVEKSNIQIKYEGKLYGINSLLIKSKRLTNQGYINSQKYSGGVYIFCKVFHNSGHIDPKNLVIMTKELYNHSQGLLKGHNGKLMVESCFENQGQIQIPSINVWDLNQGQKRQNQAKAVNSGSIIAKQLRAQVEFCQNTRMICCEKFSLSGKYEKNLMKNTGFLSCHNIMISDFIVLNTQKGGIISNGDLEIFIKGWINQGEVISNETAYASIEGHVSNEGFLQFNQGYLSSKTFQNSKYMSAKNSLGLKVTDLFVNKKEGIIKMPKLSIFTEKLRNLGSIHADNLEVISNQLTNAQTGIIKGQKAAFALHNFQNQGKANFGKIDLGTQGTLMNKGQFKADNMNFVGNHIQNKKKMEINSGNIFGKLHYNDSPEAQGTFRNLKMIATGDNTFNTEGKLSFENVDFNNSFKHFSNTKEVFFDRVAFTVDELHIKDLKMKDTHITFTSLNQEEGGKIQSKGGINSLNEGTTGQCKLTDNKNQFFINIKTEQILKKITVICQEHNQVVIGTTNPLINGWNLLHHPIAIGDFSKRINCRFFRIPGGVYLGSLKNKKPKQTSRVKQQFYQGMIQNQIPFGGQKELIIQTQHLLFGGRTKYSGTQLSLKAKNIDMQVLHMEVPDGVMKVTAEQNLFITLSYMKARGIEIKAHKFEAEGSKMCATSSDLLLDAMKIVVKPLIENHKKTWTSGDTKNIKIWESAVQSELMAEGSIMIRAEQYITMISPYAQTSKNLIISSPNTHIQGIYLYEQRQTYVKKDKTFGGSKTNVYISRNDRQLPAFLSAQNIIFEGKAKVNANFKAKKLIDLTNHGLHLFYVIGYKGKCENREFSNFFTQGCEGFMETRQKFLRADLSRVQQIIRDQNLPGKMIFDTVNWGEIRPIIKGKYEEIINTQKSWQKSWEHQTIGQPLIIVISMVCAYIGANCLAPALISSASITSPLACMAIKSSCSVICSKFFTSLAVTGDLGQAMKSTLSKDTVICAAINCLLDASTSVLAKKLQIPLDSKDFIQCLKKKFLKTALSFGAQAIKSGKVKIVLSKTVKEVIGTAVGESLAYTVNHQYHFGQKFDSCIHKALHGVIGIVERFIKGGNIHSMFAGAIGAIFSSLAIQTLMGSRQNIKNKLTASENIRQQYELQKLVAKVIGGVIGGLCCQHFQIALEAASNAVNYDFSQILQKKIDFIQKNGQSYQNTKSDQIEKDEKDARVASLAYSATDKSIQDSPSGWLKAKENALEQHKVKCKQLQSFQVVHDKNDEKYIQKDFCVIKSDKKKQIFIGVRGTQPDQLKDIIDDVKITVTGYSTPGRLNQVINYGHRIIQKFKGYSVKIVGHSLGGNLAIYAYQELSKSYGNLKCTPFNAYHGFLKPQKDKRINYIRTKHQFLFKHGISNFIEAYQQNKLAQR